MNHKHHRWLAKQIPLWVKDGLIEPKQATNIQTRYPIDDGLSLGKLLISAAGAIMIGLGIILLFAYNWAEMSKSLKLGVVFGFFATAHIAGFLAGDKRQILSESFFSLGTMLMGAAIFLVGQIYHLDSHYPDAFLLWSLGALTLAWARPSLTQAFMALILILSWHMLEVFDFDAATPWALPLVLFGVFPLVWRLHSPVLARFSAATLLISLGLVMLPQYHKLAPITLLMTSAALLFVKMRVQNSLNPAFQSIAQQIAKPAGLVFILMLFLLSFGRLVDDLIRLGATQPLGNPYFLTALLFSQTAFLWLLIKGKPNLGIVLVEAVILTALPPVVTPSLVGEGYYGLMVINFNLLLLGISVFLMVDGARQVDRWRMVSGALVFAALAMARYVDLFESLISRALVFLIVGVSLFAMANLYQRHKKPEEVEP